MIINDITPTELLFEINRIKVTHDNLKMTIIELTNVIDSTTKEINIKLDELTVVEKSYIELIEELDNRKLI